MTTNAPGKNTTASHPTPSPDALYADAVNLTAERTGMPHPLTESYILAARSGVDIVLNGLYGPDDPDALAREYVARLAHESWDTGCQRVCFHAAWDDMAEPDRNVIRAQVDAARAAIVAGLSS